VKSLWNEAIWGNPQAGGLRFLGGLDKQQPQTPNAKQRRESSRGPINILTAPNSFLFEGR
jgi:hypothetical protein